MKNFSILSIFTLTIFVFSAASNADTITCTNDSTLLTINCPANWQGQPTNFAPDGSLLLGVPVTSSYSALLTDLKAQTSQHFTLVQPSLISYVTPDPGYSRDIFTFWNSEKNESESKMIVIYQPQPGITSFPAELSSQDGNSKAKLDCKF